MPKHFTPYGADSSRQGYGRKFRSSRKAEDHGDVRPDKGQED